MEKDISDINNERIISLWDARKERINVYSAIKGNYLGYINNNGIFDFITYNGNYIAVENTKSL